MYRPTGTRTKADTAALVEALRPVAEAVNRKNWDLPSGEAKPDFFRLEISVSIREARRIIELVNAADFARLIDAA